MKCDYSPSYHINQVSFPLWYKRDSSAFSRVIGRVYYCGIATLISGHCVHLINKKMGQLPREKFNRPRKKLLIKFVQGNSFVFLHV